MTPEQVYDSILATPLPNLIDNKARRWYRKERAAKVRKLFKSLGIKGVSVTAPSYSMAQAIHIRLPYDSYHEHATHYTFDEAQQRMVSNCPICAKKNAADRHLEAIILAAYPDLEDRNDPMTDYYNYCLSFS
jgi:hypothetical protein